MGFFSRLFKRKHGGTRLGNALRQFAHDNTYGILGRDIERFGTDGINPELADDTSLKK